MSCKIAPQLMAVKLIIVEDGLTYMVYRSLPFSGFAMTRYQCMVTLMTIKYLGATLHNPVAHGSPWLYDLFTIIHDHGSAWSSTVVLKFISIIHMYSFQQNIFQFMDIKFDKTH